MSDDESPFESGRFYYARIDGRGQQGPGGGAPARERPRRFGRTAERVLGILLGLVLGIALVAAFVFLGSEETIDAPRIQADPPAREAPAGGRPEDPPG